MGIIVISKYQRRFLLRDIDAKSKRYNILFLKIKSVQVVEIM